MTKFIDVSGDKKEETKTVFTHFSDPNNGWKRTRHKSKEFQQVIYLGKCKMDGDMFACYNREYIEVHKGIKGSEFN